MASFNLQHLLRRQSVRGVELSDLAKPLMTQQGALSVPRQQTILENVENNISYEPPQIGQNCQKKGFCKKFCALKKKVVKEVLLCIVQIVKNSCVKSAKMLIVHFLITMYPPHKKYENFFFANLKCTQKATQHIFVF